MRSPHLAWVLAFSMGLAASLGMLSACGALLGVGGEQLIEDGGGPQDERSPDDACAGGLILSVPQLNLVQGRANTLGVVVPIDDCGGVGPLEVSSLPPGVSVDPVPVLDGGATELVFRATPSAQLGPSQLMVSAGSRSAPLILLVEGTSGSADTTFGDGGSMRVKGVGNLLRDGLAVTSDGAIFVAATGPGCQSSCADTVIAKLDAYGKLDPSFGNGGISSVRGPVSSVWRAFAPSTGDLVLAGSVIGPSGYASLAATALTPAGARDLAYAKAGFFTRDVAADSYARVAVIPRSGALLVGGYAAAAGVLVRVLSDGGADPSFGYEGTISAPGYVYDVGVLSTGALVELADSAPIQLASFTSQGARDPSYGTAGIATGPYASGLPSLVIQSNDECVVAANAADPSKRPTGALVFSRFHVDGIPDTSFGDQGAATVTFPSATASLGALGRSEDGRFLVAARLTTATSVSIAIARLTAGGALDPSFARAGFVVAGVEAFPDAVLAIALDSYGRILVAGVTPEADNPTIDDVLVVRYWP